MTDAPRRLLSLDVFRGLTIAGMILVNSPGLDAAYAPLRHSRWHGCTAADLVFPFFLFIMGTAMSLASARAAVDAPTGPLLKRAAVLAGWGLLFSLIPHWQPATYRFCGVLQRIALCFLAAAFLQRRLSWRAQARLAVGILLAHWAALELVPVPGFGAGVLTPEGSLESYLDRLLLGPHVYGQGSFDPEGFLGTFPSVATVLMGGLAGTLLRADRSREEKAAMLAAAGSVGLALGLLWSRWFPFNKSLWTGSYALVTAGGAALTLSACYWLLDIRRWTAWSAPFAVLGTNAIAAYVLHILGLKLIVYTRIGGVSPRILIAQALFGSWLEPKAASLAFALSYAALWTAVLTPLYRRGIFLKA